MLSGVFREERVSRRLAGDALFVSLSGVHAAILIAAPSIPVIAIGLWWNANTIAHNFIHRPFFRSQRANDAYALGLSLLLGIPQTYWRDRHLRHHTGIEGRAPFSSQARVEAVAVLAMFAIMAPAAPSFFLFVYLPGWLAGLGLCRLQGYYEHERGTTSHYGRLYNWLFFNDGYHVEHHARPGVHWSELARFRAGDARTSAWPAVLRWIDDLRAAALDGLERLVLCSPGLQRFVVERHRDGVRRLLKNVGDINRVTVVGGGLFPRTALVMRQLFPNAAVTVVDANAAHLEIARRYLPPSVALRHATFGAEPGEDDLIVIPLAFIGDRRRIYDDPPARRVLVHDWIWAVRPGGVIISWLLLKRLTLVTR